MPAQGRRVVITGIGLVTPLGNDLKSNWTRLMAGESGVGRITRFDPAGLPVQIAGEVRDFDPTQFMEKKEARRNDSFTHFAMAAAEMAVRDSGLSLAALQGEQTGVILGTGMGGMMTMEETAKAFAIDGIKKVSPFFVPRLISNMAPAQIAMRFGAKGVNFVTTSACSSGTQGVGESARQIRFGYQDIMLAGGTESGVTPLSVAGFAVMRALSTRNDEPQRASRPFERDRDGFVLSEGAAILVLETLDAARARGARIYAEIAGYAANSDAYHITTPAPEGAGAARCMQLALSDARLQPSDIGYINAHGTSTPYNDVNETSAIKHVFGEHAWKLAVSSTKSMIGHALGAAGAIEAAYTALALHHQTLPPTINYEHQDPQCDLDYVPNHARAATFDAALSNSFAFGGANACVALRKVEPGEAA